MDISKFVNIRVHDGFIVKRIDGTQEAHAHFKNRQGGQKLLMLIERDTMPKAEYFAVAAKRILTDDEFNGLRVKQKEPYYNRNAKQFGRRVI